MELFRYSTDLLRDFPTIRGGAVNGFGTSNATASPQLQEAFLEEQQRTLAKLGNRPLAHVPSLAAWRRAFTEFGVKPTQHRNAAEALLRRLTKKGDVPSVNTLVDIANLISIRYALPVAAFDLHGIDGPITVRRARGDEPFLELRSSEAVSPAAGEVIFADDHDRVHARRWCWRQSAQSATSPSTTEVLITVEGHHRDAERDVEAATADLLELAGQHVGGTYRFGQLSPANPSL